MWLVCFIASEATFEQLFQPRACGTNCKKPHFTNPKETGEPVNHFTDCWSNWNNLDWSLQRSPSLRGRPCLEFSLQSWSYCRAIKVRIVSILEYAVCKCILLWGCLWWYHHNVRMSWWWCWWCWWWWTYELFFCWIFLIAIQSCTTSDAYNHPINQLQLVQLDLGYLPSNNMPSWNSPELIL